MRASAIRFLVTVAFSCVPLVAAQACPDGTSVLRRAADLVKTEPSSSDLCKRVQQRLERDNEASARVLSGSRQLKAFEKSSCEAEGTSGVRCMVRFLVLARPAPEIVQSVTAQSRRHLGDVYLGIVLNEHVESRTAELHFERVAREWVDRGRNLVAASHAARN